MEISYEHEKVFRADYKTLEQLLRGFETELFGVFVESIEFPKKAVIVPPDVLQDQNINVNESTDATDDGGAV